MGLLYIAGTLERAGHEVRVLDLLVTRSEKKVVAKAISDFNPAMVGITSVTMNWPEASEILKWVKEIDPSIKTVAGGPHVTFTWQEIGQNEPWVDYVVLGEGEETVIELTDRMFSKGGAFDIAGLAWRENGAMKAGARREFIKDLDSLPKPSRHLFPLARYRLMGVDGGVSTGRGCPFDCIFCVGSRMVGHKARLRSPKAVVDEIEDIVKMGFRDVAFSDDHFGMKRSHAIAVCDEIIGRKLDVNLSIFIRADAAEPELLAKMRAAGCSWMLYGAESGVQKIVDLTKKKTDLNMLREKVKLALSMGFKVQVTFIVGLPGETRETIKQTFDYAVGLGTFFGMHVLAPLPGSELFERADELGLKIFHHDWKLFDANHVVSETEGISAAEIEKFASDFDNAFSRMDEIETEAWKRGELSGQDIERVESRKHRAFFWALMGNGFFDSEMCGVDVSEHPDYMKALLKRAQDAAKTDEWETEKWIAFALKTGDLFIEENGNIRKFAISDRIYV